MTSAAKSPGRRYNGGTARLFPTGNVRTCAAMSNDSKGASFGLFAAAIFGLLGVGLGAFGAHGLRATLAERGTLVAWETASRYQLIHAVALIAVAAVLRTASDVAARSLRWAMYAWSIGIIVFSGSLYLLALGGPRWLGPVTPLGGIAFLLGWALLAVAAFRK
jgi:uncharacterized membrane protein YgdD (TMEM256/DUF423 family)